MPNKPIPEGIETRPYLVRLKYIIVPQQKPVSKGDEVIAEAAKSIKKFGYNTILPVVCLAEDRQYHLLSGLSLYEAAKEVGNEIGEGSDLKIWVFVIAEWKEDAVKVLSQIPALSKLNEVIPDTADISAFRAFLNNKKSKLTSISGIGKVKADLIIKNRPYKSLDDLNKHKGFGPKQTENWLRAFSMMKG